MKQLFLVSCAGLLLACGSSYDSSGSTSSGWTLKSSSGTAVPSTCFITSDAGTAVTGCTTDGQTSGDFAVDFVNSSTGWFVGNLGEVLVTTNGGGAVNNINSGAAALGTSGILRSVVALTTSNVYISGLNAANDGSSIYHTNNGGTTWTIQSTTTDKSGVTTHSSDRINSLSFANTSFGMAAGGYGNNTGFILLTTDGSTWTEVYNEATTGSVSGDQLQRIFVVNTSVAYAVGNAGAILQTTDSGTTWTQQTSGTSQDLFGVLCSDINTCVVVGRGGTILRTTDGGTTWTSISSGTSYDLVALSSSTSSSIWAGGDYGTMLHSTDGGLTWTAQTSNTHYIIQAIDMISDTVGWAVAASTSSNVGAVLYTATGGQ